jgi:hypothetical protein
MIIKALTNIPYFTDLDEEILNAIAQHLVQKIYTTDQVVFLEGYPCAGLGIVHKGLLKSVRYAPSGREQTISLLHPGEIFNAVGVFAKTSNPVTVIALKPTSIWLLSGERLQALQRRYPTLTQRIVQNLAERTLALVDLVEDLSLRTVEMRLAIVVGGTLVFGFLYGILLKSSPLNPNPVASLRTVLVGALVRHEVALPLVGMLVVLLIVSWVSNKSLCGNGCQLGLLQDLLYRVPVPKWQPPFKISNTVRVVAFVSLLGSLIIAGLDWIGIIDPFQIFQFKFTMYPKFLHNFSYNISPIARKKLCK